MASRPVASRGGLTGAHYGMIAFAIVSVACLAMFILMLTRVSSAEEAAASAQGRLDRYGNPPQYYASEAQNRRSRVFAVMDEDRRTMASLITGNPEDVAVSAVAKTDALLAEVARGKPAGAFQSGATLLSALEELDRLYREQRASAEESAAAVEALAQETSDLNEQLLTKDTEYAEQVDALQVQLQQLRQGTDAAVTQKEDQLQTVQASLDAREQEVQRMKRDHERSVQDLNAEIIRLRDQIVALQREIKGFKVSLDPSAILTKADGRILRAIPGSELVYINLGEVDNIKPGMGFEVFSQSGDTPAELSGKASLEVVTVMEETAECRVVRRTPGYPILEDDVVVNIAFERGRRPKFVIRGDFDLNYDGQVDWDGLEQVASMIRQWGGQVVDDVDESVDFVVIGLPPMLPAFARNANVSPIVRAQTAQRELELSEFRNLVDKAQKMYIPVITQNPFLFLTGYAGTGQPVPR